MDFGKFFGTAFAESGDKVEIPVESQPSNAVSFTSGYTQDYSLNITTDPRAKSISRTGQNYLFWAITSALGGLQRFGAPSWVGPDDNGGVPLAYPKGARVQQGNEFYVSLVPNNTRALTDSTAWAVATYSPASNAEALTGTAADLLLTPASLRYVLQNTSIGQPASVTVAGVTRYATSAETQAGVVTTAAVTPAGLKPLADSKANVNAPTFVGPVSVNTGTLGGQATALAVNRANGTLAWSMGNYGDASLRLLSWDSAGANPVTRVVFGPQPATADDFPSVEFRGSLSTTNGISTVGRVSATVTATETATSTTRLATAAEMTAGATTVAASPGRITAWAAGQYLPINNPRVSGNLRVSGSGGGVEFYNPANNTPLFYTEATGYENTRFLFKSVPDGAVPTRDALDIERSTGRVSFPNGVTIPTGQTITADPPSTTNHSVVRMGTQAEVNASTLTNVAVSPTTLSSFVSGRYLPLTGGQITGIMRVSSSDNGFNWATPGGITRFFTNAESGANGGGLAINGCDDNGSYLRTIMTLDRRNGEVTVTSLISNYIGGNVIRNTSRADKKDIHRNLSAAEAIERVNAYRAYMGSWKPDAYENADTRERPFFLAHEVAEHAPSLVGIDPDGEPGNVGYSEEVPSIMVVLQHLLRTVERQSVEIAALQAERK